MGFVLGWLVFTAGLAFLGGNTINCAFADSDYRLRTTHYCFAFFQIRNPKFFCLPYFARQPTRLRRQTSAGRLIDSEQGLNWDWIGFGRKVTPI